MKILIDIKWLTLKHHLLLISLGVVLLIMGGYQNCGLSKKEKVPNPQKKQQDKPDKSSTSKSKSSPPTAYLVTVLQFHIQFYELTSQPRAELIQGTIEEQEKVATPQVELATIDDVKKQIAQGILDRTVIKREVEWEGYDSEDEDVEKTYRFDAAEEAKLKEQVTTWVNRAPLEKSQVLLLDLMAGDNKIVLQPGPQSVASVKQFCEGCGTPGYKWINEYIIELHPELQDGEVYRTDKGEVNKDTNKFYTKSGGQEDYTKYDPYGLFHELEHTVLRASDPDTYVYDPDVKEFPPDPTKYNDPLFEEEAVIESVNKLTSQNGEKGSERGFFYCSSDPANCGQIMASDITTCDSCIKKLANGEDPTKLSYPELMKRFNPKDFFDPKQALKDRMTQLGEKVPLKFKALHDKANEVLYRQKRIAPPAKAHLVSNQIERVQVAMSALKNHNYLHLMTMSLFLEGDTPDSKFLTINNDNLAGFKLRSYEITKCQGENCGKYSVYIDVQDKQCTYLIKNKGHHSEFFNHSGLSDNLKDKFQTLLNYGSFVLIKKEQFGKDMLACVNSFIQDWSPHTDTKNSKP